MTSDQILTLVAFVSAIISVVATVGNVLFSRRGMDSELKADVEDLAITVERLAKASRREKMARVRQGGPLDNVAPAAPESVPAMSDYKTVKAELRRRVLR